MNYPVRRAPAHLDRWGNLKGRPLALVLHMTEGNAGLGGLAYLAGDPERGVTVHFYAQDNGVIWRMLDLDRISGSLNPGDIAGTREDKGHYGRRHLRAVLGAHYQDPNSYSITMEIGGRAAKGPTPAQVKAITAWGLDMRRQFPTIRGALGHADCTDTKGCPGTSAAMRSIFAGIGGHGLFSAAPAPATEDDVLDFDLQPPAVGTFTYDQRTDHRLIGLDGRTLPKAIPAGYTRGIFAIARLAKPYGTGPGDRQTVYLTDLVGTPAFCLAADGTYAPRVEPAIPGPADDCLDEIAAATKPLEKRLADIAAIGGQ
jgi:hypothetical protein